MPKGPQGCDCPYCGKRIALPRIHKILFGVVYEALKKHEWSATATAKELGLGYKTVRNWIERYRKIGMNIPRHERDRVDKTIDTVDWVNQQLGERG